MKNLLAAILVLCSAAGVGEAAVVCNPVLPVPGIVPPEPSVQVTNYLLGCENSGAAQTLVFDLSLFLNTTVTSQPVDASGHVQTLAILEEFPFALATPTLGVDAFYATRPSLNQLKWTGLSVFAPENGAFSIRIDDIWADAKAVGVSGMLIPNVIFGFAATEGVDAPVVENGQVVLAYVVRQPTQPVPTPEPATALSAVAGIAGMVLLRRKTVGGS
ncbi:MAG TPA: hypothetical protein VER03_11725, partial [Bryobacteraceae bacterium]|nr:hypothetical protein [Bryobacteraceae bacterium]